MRLDGRRSATGTGAPGLGRKKIFEVRKLYNDITFIDEFFTLEFCIEQKFYSFGFQRAQRQLGDHEPRVQEGEGSAAAAC